MRERTERGGSIYQLDEELLAELAPDLIVTQALCAVCAVSYDDVEAIAQRMDPPPRDRAGSEHPGRGAGRGRAVGPGHGRQDQARELVADAAARTDRVRLAVRAQRRPRVAALEWLDPVFVAGHWTRS